jgi:periplasmic protein TonB
MAMPDDLFGDVGRSRRRMGPRPWYILPLSIATHGVAIAAIVVIPLVATVESPELELQRLRRASTFTDVVLEPPMPPPERGTRVAASTGARPDARAPIVAPATIEPERTLPLTEDSAGVPGGDPNGVPGGLPTATAEWAPPPPIEPPKGPLPISRGIRPPQKVAHVNPAYPPAALAARVQGTVIIEAIIGPTGRVERARVVKSEPLLDEAALAAVRQWRYTPTLLNNTPVSVILTVSVRFSIP